MYLVPVWVRNSVLRRNMVVHTSVMVTGDVQVEMIVLYHNMLVQRAASSFTHIIIQIPCLFATYIFWYKKDGSFTNFSIFYSFYLTASCPLVHGEPERSIPHSLMAAASLDCSLWKAEIPHSTHIWGISSQGNMLKIIFIKLWLN